MGRICKVCADPEYMQIAAEMIAAGQPDRAVAEALGGMNRMAVQRHRTGHMAGKPGVVAVGRQAAEQRLAALEAAPDMPFDPVPYLSRDGIAADLDAIDRRLSIAATAAAVDGRSAALAQLSAQQLRVVEARAKLGEVGGYGRDRGNGNGGSGPFSIIMNFGNDRLPLTVAATGQPQNEAGEVVEAAWRLSPPSALEPHPLATGGPPSVFRTMRL